MTKEETMKSVETTLIRAAGQKGVPATTASTIINYMLYGMSPGGFVSAVLRNDLIGAFSMADSTNLNAMFSIVSFLYNDCPAELVNNPNFVPYIEREV